MNRREEDDPGYDSHEHSDTVSKTIPVIEEQWEVNKRVSTRKVSLKKEIHEEEVPINVPEMHEHINIERKEVNQEVDSAPPAIRYEGDTMIIPVLREEIIVQKRLILVEEIHVTKHHEQKSRPQKVKLRREEIVVERENNPPA